MWIFTESGFVNIATGQSPGGTRNLSGWRKEHLRAFLDPIAVAPPIVHSAGTQYPYHADVPLSWLLIALGEHTRSIAYTDFHGSIVDDALRQWVAQALQLAPGVFGSGP